MKSSHLAEAIRTPLQLIDGLAVVVTREFEFPKLAVDVTADFERRGEGIDVIEI